MLEKSIVWLYNINRIINFTNDKYANTPLAVVLSLIVFYVYRQGENMKKHQNDGKNPGFILQFIKSVYVLAALFFAAMALTACIAAYQYDLFTKLRASGNVFLFVAITAGIFALAAFLFGLLNARLNKINITDCGAFALLFFAVIYTIYVIANDGIDAMTFNRIILVATALVSGIIYLVIRAILYNRTEKNTSTYSFAYYIRKVTAKFGISFVFAVAAVLICTAYLLLDDYFRPVLTEGVNNNPVIIYVSVAAAVLCLIYAIVCLWDKQVNALDAVFVSGIILIPVTLLDIILVNNASVKQLTVWAVILGVYLIFVILRVIISGAKKEKPAIKEKTGYFCKLSARYNPFFIISAAAVFAVFLNFFYGTNVLSSLLPRNKFSFMPELSSIPAVFLVAITALALVSDAVIAFAGLKAKYITPSDFAISAGLAASLMSFSLLAIINDIYVIVTLVALTFYFAILLAIRARNFSSK